MRLLLTPPALWSHLADGFEHQWLEQVSNCESRSKEYEIAEIGVEEGVDMGSGIKYSLLPNVVLQGGTMSMVRKWTT